ncbi:aminoglycoside 6-adenylyltransferase [Sunxiuqinia elliptica]|uniref:Aminoglycoside 6-adenylyltransferase n=1 Tax=Sunxiuqinia elliptica TaxID=655355 RepID=A0A4R6GRI4_9BACT|nr:aminoglycoside 6-adenylyltransferase [Sunxiuqinia elliptica]TDN97727.1 aminoglycoside 6-adenylyltransferase [Sunxiuqinia elliptica]TDO67082.1 aminoglycoside 6-adenylyltransferase [Sunxiuqinia elliptica]
MKSNSETYNKFMLWAEDCPKVDVVIITSSRANPYTKTDILSDYDIELYVNDFTYFRNDDNWNEKFGDVIIKWPLNPESTFDKNRITRLVQYKNFERIDFQISMSTNINPIDLDNGYKVLIDKINATSKLQKPSYQNHIIRKPSEKEYIETINSFFWNSTYVAKALKRDEIYFAKYMLDYDIRFHSLQKMIEWFIGFHNEWSLTTNKFGRLFKNYLDDNMWSELEKTYAGARADENWIALENVISFFRNIATLIGEKLGYTYPEHIDQNVCEYNQEIKNLSKL